MTEPSNASDWISSLKDNAISLVESGYYQGFVRTRKLKLDRFLLIPEVKPASPSEGRMVADPVLQLRNFQDADAVSILVEPNYFGGNLSLLPQAVPPVLQKDIIVHPSQMVASTVLLIKKVMGREIHSLLEYAQKEEIDVVLEVDNVDDFVMGLDLPCKFLGINNRDLDTMKVDVGKAAKILKEYHDGTPVIALSGYSGVEEVQDVRDAGAAGVVIGTHFSRSSNPRMSYLEMREALECC